MLVLLVALELLVALLLDELFSLEVEVELCELELPELSELDALDALDWLLLDSLLNEDAETEDSETDD